MNSPQRAARVTPAATLIVKNGDRAGASLRVADDETTIGRRADATLVLADPRVSRLHASLRCQAGMYVLTDLGSTSGTLVNGKKIDGPTTIHHGDTLQLGSVEIGFEHPTELGDVDDDTMVFDIPDEVRTGPQLSPRQQDVLEGIAQGMTNNEIADQLGITERTVKAYAQELYVKLDVNNRAAAVAEAVKLGLLDI